MRLDPKAIFPVSDFDAAVLARSHTQPVVAVFTSAGLPLGGWLEQVLVPAVRGRPESIALAVIDVDRDPALVVRQGVQLLPTVKGFRRGERVAGFISARPPDAVNRFLDSLLAPSEADRMREELRAEREWTEVVAALDEADYERAFELLLARAESGGATEQERVRRLMVSLFAQLGPSHPLSIRYRRRLAAMLY
jgi:thioredoxin-like negative regulator of GroEL